MAEKETVETITKAYEQKIIELQKQHEEEINVVKNQMEKEKQEEITKLKEEHNKELADYILGRKQINELENDNKESEEKSFFDKAVEQTKQILGIK